MKPPASSTSPTTPPLPEANEIVARASMAACDQDACWARSGVRTSRVTRPGLALAHPSLRVTVAAVATIAGQRRGAGIWWAGAGCSGHPC